MSFIDAQRGFGVIVEGTNAFVFSTLRFHAMVTPDEVGQGHGVADALDEVSIKQGRESFPKKTKFWGRCRLEKNALAAQNRNDTRRRVARAGRCGPSEGWRRSAAKCSGSTKCTLYSGLG